MILSNNRISKISKLIYKAPFGESMPNLENLILSNNKITDYEEITYLKNCTKLERLSLVNNPITSVI